MYVTMPDGVRLFYDVVGPSLSASEETVSEKQTILILHGGPGLDHMVFRPAFDALQSNVQVIYLDQRGCGRSDDGSTESWNLNQWADDVASVIEALGLRHPIVLGTSFGGFVAQRFASGHKDLSGGLVLMSTAYGPDIEGTLDCLEAAGGKQAREAAARFFSNASAAGVVDTYFETCLGLYTYGDIDLSIIGRVTQRTDVMMHFFQEGGEFFNIDLSKDLQQISVPILIVHGVQDPIFPIAHARKTVDFLETGGTDSERIRHEFIEIEKCGHLSEQDAPEKIISEIVRFFGLA